MANKTVIVDISVKNEQLKQATELVKQLVLELNKLKKAGASITILKEQEKAIKETVKAVKTLQDAEKKAAQEKAKSSKTEYGFGIKKLEFTKIQLQQIKALQDAEKKAAQEKAKNDKKAESDEIKRIKAYEKATQALIEENDWLQKEAKSLADIEAQNRALVAIRKKLDLTNQDNIATYNELTERISANQKKLNEENDKIGRHQGNVGNYIDVWREMPGVLGAAGEATQGLGQAFKMLLANPIVALIAAIVAGLTFLFNQFTKTGRGAKMLQTAMAYLDASLALIQKSISTLANYLANLSFDKIKKDLSDIGQNLLKNTPYVNAFKNAIAAIASLLQGDFSNAGEKTLDWLKNVKDGLLQAVIPVYSLADGFGGVAKEIDKTAQAYLLLKKQQTNSNFANMAMLEQLEKLRGQQELLRTLVDDDTRSFKEREGYVNQLVEANKKYANLQLAMSKNALQLAKNELAVERSKTTNIELLEPFYKKMSDATIELTRAENEYAQTVQDNGEIIKKMRRDEWEQRIDTIFDIFDAEKTVNEDKIKNEKLTAEQRKAIYLKTQAELEEVYLKLNKLFSEASSNGASVDIAKILNIEGYDQRYQYIKNNLGLDEIEATQLLDKLKNLTTFQNDMVNMSKDVVEITKNSAQASYDAAVDAFEKKQELEKEQNETKLETDQQKAEFELQQQIELDQKKLALAQEFGIAMSDVDKMLLEQKIANNQAELDSFTKTSQSKNELKQKEIESQIIYAELAKTLVGEETKAGKAIGLLQRGLALKQAFLSAKVALAKAWASAAFPYNIPAVLKTAAETGLITAAISAVKFRRGGEIKGPSHENGGVRAELEGNEFIVNKKSTQIFKKELYAINSYNGYGVGMPGAGSKMFERGGITPSADRQNRAANAQVPTQTIVQPVIFETDLAAILLKMRNEADTISGI